MPTLMKGPTSGVDGGDGEVLRQRTPISRIHAHLAVPKWINTHEILSGPYHATTERWGWSNLLKISWSKGSPAQWPAELNCTNDIPVDNMPHNEGNLHGRLGGLVF